MSDLPHPPAQPEPIPVPQPSVAALVPVEPTADEAVRTRILAVRTEVGKVVVGQDAALSGLVSALLVGGHVLVEGVPGVAKTLLVKTLAQSLSLHFNRVQFTPDLMPSDVVGQMIFDSQASSFRFRQGPVFTNFLLADEINRTPPKTQAALLEAMEESQVTVGGHTYPLPQPFVTIATQNPIEYEGTYPLPEAQLDRFLLKLLVDYPQADQEFEIVSRHHRGMNPHDVVASGVTAVASPADILHARELVKQVQIDDQVIRYIVDICRATRTSPSVMVGVPPRGTTALLHATKAWTWLVGRTFATPDEVKAIVYPALRHRLLLRPELELDGLTTDAVLDSILATVPTPR